MNIDLLKSVADSQPYPLMFATISGAHLYGFPSPDSDYDLRGVHILPVREVITLDEPKDIIEISRHQDGIELDLVTYDVKKFFQMMLKPNGNVLEQIYSPLVICTSPEHDELKTIVPQCLTRHQAHHYFGMSRTRWDLFAKEKRVKPLLYMYRALLTGIHLMQTGEVEPNLLTLNAYFKLPYIDELVARKTTGAERSTLDSADMDFHRSEFERLTAQLEKAQQKTHLPEYAFPCHDTLNDLLTRIRLAYL